MLTRVELSVPSRKLEGVFNKLDKHKLDFLAEGDSQDDDPFFPLKVWVMSKTGAEREVHLELDSEDKWKLEQQLKDLLSGVKVMRVYYVLRNT